MWFGKLMVLGAVLAASLASKKPNIIVIVADDMVSDFLPSPIDQRALIYWHLWKKRRRNLHLVERIREKVT
jgi:hypothetical protein